MLSTQQKSCVNLVVENMPASIKESPVIVDVADESMRHIMGGDPLESLLVKSIRQVLTNSALISQEQWIGFLKNNHLDNFCNCFLNMSPELMMSLFENCSWAPSDAEKQAKITLKATNFLLEIDNKTYISFANNDSILDIPYWLPYLLRRFCEQGLNKIDIQFEGPPSEIEQLSQYEKLLFTHIQNTDYSARGNHLYPATTVDWKYNMIRGSVCFAAHSKRKGGTTVFAKLNRLPGTMKRDVNEVMKTDFA